MLARSFFYRFRPLVAIGAHTDYFTSPAHYEAAARRIVVALNAGGNSLVLVTGDPPVNPQALSEAMANVAPDAFAIIIVSCGPALKRESLDGTRTSASDSVLFLFDDIDRLSDRQIQEICDGLLHAAQVRRVAVFLAPVDFTLRLERPPLRFLRERITSWFRFQEVGDPQAIVALHHQLLSRRDGRLEARGFRHGLLVGLGAGGAVLALGIGTLILSPTAQQICQAIGSTGRSDLLGEAPMSRSRANAATSVMSEHHFTETDTPPALTEPAILPQRRAEDTPPTVTPAGGQRRVARRLPAAEIVGLLARGDAFLSAGDVTSARLFYERAASAESGLAALQLGGTFDPMILARSGIYGAQADPVQALSWYRRARELSVNEAEQRINALETRFPEGTDAPSR